MATLMESEDGAVDGLTLIVGDRFEFCLTLYGALLRRLPDPEALRHFETIPAAVEPRLAEVRRVLVSDEYLSRPRPCVLDDAGTPPALDDPRLRLSNFMSYVMPHLHQLILGQQDLIRIKSDEIGGLMREILLETTTEELTRRAEPSAGASHVDNARVEALGREVEALKTYVQWELPKKLLRVVNHTIMTNNAEMERQLGVRR